ncbi:D-ribose ABC transporter substrate-binding protein [Bacilli bacterium]|nr:D-ribose ABC transporter substrate-binding protein [Bacilli bacterium]
MKLKKVITVAVGMALSISFLVGCGKTGLDNGSNNETTKTEKKAKDLKIGVSLSTLNNPFFVDIQTGVKELADEKGSTIKILDAQDDTAKQSNDIEDLIQQGVDVILVNPVDSSAIVPAVESANQAGIPVIAIDRGSDGGKILATVASNNVSGGEMAADYIVEQLGEKAKVLQLQGTPGASATRERGKGFEKVAKEKLAIVDSQSANFDRAEGLTVTENMLQAHKDVAAIFAQNDEMALGAVEAVTASGLKSVVIVGFDGTDDGLKAIKDGTLSATIAQQPKEMGRLALQAAYDHFAGKDVKATIDSPVKLIKK